MIRFLKGLLAFGVFCLLDCASKPLPPPPGCRAGCVGSRAPSGVGVCNCPGAR